jgi:hypothetical protein
MMFDALRNALWVMERIARTRPDGGGDPSTDVQPIVDALLALKSKKNLHVFGIVPAAVEAEGKQQVIDACERALRDWHRAFTRDGNRFGLWELSRASASIGMPEFRLEEPFPLLCDPLGDSSHLDPTWKSRIDRVRATVARRGVPSLEGLGFEPKRRIVKFGPLDRKALYAQALRFETYTRKAFPREVAAFWSIADGMSVDSVWYFAPAKQWTLHGSIEDALIFGAGRFARGTLALVPGPGGNMAEAQVVDFDVNGQLFRRYPSFAALVDVLLAPPGAPPPTP